ncbi:hypothetical protein PC117_g16346 [Phytophthora cactorum]|uniref:Uncharacterized protein n=1 Tax=Phytophthora cactorum TaxID=29920 RepID=A0A8T1CGD1_9STRA|nr:hypothetical protein PC117_g16346 [Phytophthora cactorum]
MPTNAQLQAEIDRLNQVMADRTRVPTNLPKSTGKRGEDVREWMSQVENACRINYIPIEDASTRIPGIAGSAMEKPASAGSCTGRRRLEARSTGGGFSRLKQTTDIESYNGEYSALIFRVEGISMLDQVLCYANGLKSHTRIYVKLENLAR